MSLTAPTVLQWDSVAVRGVCITIDTEYPDWPCADPLAAFDRQLEVLAARGVRATFFVVGAWARAHPDRVAAVNAAGHLLGNHSYSHCNLSRLTPDGIAEDLTECQQALAELGIETRPWFRAPYGEMTSRADVRSAVERAGYRHVPWNVDTEDWRGDEEVQEAASRVVMRIKRRWPRTATVLLHSWPEPTPRLLDVLLEQLTANRATFMTVAQHAGRRLTF